jgi:PAS domain S-box-containing protein
MWIGWGPEMTFLYNDAYLHVLGPAKHPHALGNPASRVWAEIWDVCGPLANKVFESGEASVLDDVRLFMDRGDFVEETFYSFSYSPIRDESGLISGLFCPSTDVTPKVLNTRRLRTLSELAANSLIEKTTTAACATAARILSKNPDDIPFVLLYLADADGRFARLGQAVGTTRLDAVNPVDLILGSGTSLWPIGEVFHSGQRQTVSAALFSGLPTGLAGKKIEEAVVLPVASRGEHRPYGVIVVGVNPCRPLDADHLTFFELLAGQVATAMQNARAAEEEKTRADMPVEIDRAKTVFFSNISHEFRTPLTLMLGPLENLLAKSDIQAGDHEQLAVAHRNSLRLLKLVNSLLDFSRLEAGRLKASYKQVDLSALTGELASNFRSAIEAAGLEMHVDCGPLPEPVYVDQEMWEKVVLNLLSNAFKFTFEGQVAVRLAAEDGAAVLTVSDSGIGIPERELPRLFEPFHRVEGAKGRTYEGTGIGLALIQEYVKLHGGSISVASSLGAGSTFTVKVPFGTAHLPADRIARADNEEISSTRRAQAYTDEALTWLPREMNVHPPAGLEMVGADAPEQVLGKNVYDLVAPEFRDAFRNFNESICRGEPSSLQFEITGLKGCRRQMEIHAAPLDRPDGTTVQLAITRDVTERQLRERAPLLLSAIVDSSDDAIISKDLNGIITSWNKSAERLFGYTAAEAVGKSVAELLIPFDREEEEPEILARLRRGERVDHFETVRRRKDGTLLDISLTVSPVKDSEGRVIGASKIARDISDRKRIETAIQSLNAQLTSDLSAVTRMQQLSTRLVQADDFSQLLDEIVDAGIEITGADMGNIQLLDEGALRIVSQRGFEQPLLDFFNQVHGGEFACGTALQSGRRVIVEDVATSPVFAGSPACEVMLAAGARAVQSTPLVSRSGQVLGMFSTLFNTPHSPSERDLRLLDVLARQAADLIERKRAETALVVSEARFRQLADAMPQIVWTARPDGQVDYYNERWYEFTGFGRDNFGDASWEPILHPDDVKHCYDTWYASVRSGQPYRIEYRFRDRHESRWRWFMGRALPVRDNEGRIVKWFGSCTDIDEQKRVEEKLRRANNDLEQFAYSASHDLQEPLRSIKIYGELLTERYSSKLDGQAFEFLDYLRTGASRMEMLVRDLLAYTQVTTPDAAAEPTDANQALATALASLSHAISESGATITFDPLPFVRLHSTHLRQIFQNLISNAIKYRSPDRTPAVHITAQHNYGSWIFSVRDNGIGIEPEYNQVIFGLFKRLHSGEEYSGTGIGLAICQRIVERYHGRIWVESEPGRGSTFRFEVPSDHPDNRNSPQLSAGDLN